MTGQPWVQKKYWTPEEDAYLKRLIAQGMTDRQIAVHLGRSKNTIIGRGHRSWPSLHQKSCCTSA